MLRRLTSPALGACVALAIALALLPADGAGQPLRVGFEIVNGEDDPSIAKDTVVWRYRGPIEHPLAANLEELERDLPHRYRVVVLELDSRGGELRHTKLVVEILKRLRTSRKLHTVVTNGASCLSACIPVFMQGERRQAGSASAWLFHGACSRLTNVPSPEATSQYLQMLIESGVAREFLCRLEDAGVFSKPGQFWLSGYELHTSHAGITTELLPAWLPQDPVHPPFDPKLRPR